MSRSVRVLLVDDHPIVRDGLRLVIERSGFGTVVGEADNGREALELVARLGPDLAIVDIGMSELNGIDTTVRIKESSPSTRVLILSGHSSADFVIRALKAGADGYLVKDSLGADLAAAMKAVMSGGKYLSPRISQHVVDGILGANKPPGGEDGKLSSRQREVLQMIAEGKTTKEMAFVLGLSTKTIETHRARIIERLGIRDVAGLVVYAIQNGLIDLDAKRP